MQAWLFVLLNIGPVFCAYVLTRKYFHAKSGVDNLLAFFVLLCSEVIGLIILLGSMRALRLPNILLVDLALFSFALFILRPAGLRSLKNDLSYFLTWLRNAPTDDKILAFCLSFLCGFALIKVAVNLINPPFGWDDLNYHFTFAVEWLKSGTLATPIVVSDYPAPSYYPLNGSFFFYWLMIPFRNVFLADLGQVPFFAVVFLCMVSIGKKIGLKSRHSLFAAILLAGMPNYFKQLSIAYVDVMVAAFFLLGINFLFSLQEDFNGRNALLSALSAGLLLGTKVIAIPHVLMLCLFFFWMLLARFKKARPSQIILFLAIFTAGVLLTGGFSYVKNYFLTGNPLYPLNVKVLNLTIFKGILGGEFLNTADNSFSLEKLLFHEGVGAGFLLFAIPGLILAVMALLRKKTPHRPSLGFLFGVVIALYLVYRYGVGLPNARYLYPWFAVCFMLAIWGIGAFSINSKIIDYALIVCTLASTAELAKRTELITSFILSAIIFVLFLKIKRIKPFLLAKPAITFLIFFIFGAFLLQYLYMDYAKNEFSRYKLSQKKSGFWPEAIDGWIWLDQNTSGNKIAYVGRPVPFPLYGSSFKNDVFYVSVNNVFPQLHYYKDSWYSCKGTSEDFHKVLMEPNNYRGKADYSQWLENLSDSGADYLFVYSLHQTKTIQFPIEDNWARQAPDKFSLAFTNSTIRIYKIGK